MKYWVIDCFDADASTAVTALMNGVERFLDLGWKPVGGVCVTHIPHGRNYGVELDSDDGYLACQALTHDGDGPLPE